MELKARMFNVLCGLSFFMPVLLPAQDMSTDEKAVRDVLQTVVTAYGKRDAAAAVSVYAPQVVQMDVPAPIYSIGKQGNYKATVDFFASVEGNINMKYTDIHVKVYPGGQVATAWAVARFDVPYKAGIVLGGRDHFKMNIRVVDVMEKQSDGKWLIVIEHSSLPMDLKEGKPIYDGSNASTSGPDYSAK